VHAIYNCVDNDPTRYFSDGGDSGVEMVCG
jgi:hypothetical protein